MAKTTSTEAKVAGGLGLAAVAAAAAAGYFFYGKGGSKHRKEFQVWSKGAKLEMIKKIKAMKVVSKQAYDTAAKEVMAKYKAAKSITPEEAAVLGSELKKHWVKISQDLQKVGKKPAAPAKKTLKKKAKK